VPGAHGADGQTLIATVGARIADSLRHAGAAIAEEVAVPASPPQITATVAHLLYLIDDWREHQGLHELILCYNRHQGSKTYQSTELLLLPLDLRQFHRLQEERWPSPRLPTFSMDRALLLSRLLHQYLFVCIFRACAESLASEHAARLEAMHAAQRNIDERLELLTTSFRRTRQEAITAELLDVVSGFESVSATLP
jgi:F-type H+-transporting ATPase subunit gamma